jgi:hypothetical protein
MKGIISSLLDDLSLPGGSLQTGRAWAALGRHEEAEVVLARATQLITTIREPSDEVGGRAAASTEPLQAWTAQQAATGRLHNIPSHMYMIAPALAVLFFAALHLAVRAAGPWPHGS